VWTYGNRTLTSSHLTPADIKAIWDYSGSQATTLGSLGKLLVDNLDAQVSTRATQGEVASLLIGVAQESTLVNATTDIINALNECKSKLNNITVKVLQIKAKTDTLPASPASEATLQSGIDIIRTDIAEVDNRTIQIKVDTDRIPTDPAKESSVHAIPTNPLLTTDARLNNLDARISTRSTLTVADLDFLASDTELANAQNLILSEIDQTQTQVSSLTDTTNHIRSDVHTIQMTQATMTALLAAENAILTAIASIEDGPELSAEQVWSYPTRTITQDPASFGPDISQLATKTDVAAISAVNQYLNKMTTTFNPATGYQEVLVWAEKNGQEVTVASDCLIEIKDSLGAIKWSQSSSIPNGDGVFRFVNPIVVVQDSNYYITIKIKVDGALRITTQAFITVG
jgi:hypothetical protein